jgi:uncharacterized membrane protein YeaQ/YmgE (transglycosylase-associated protein family)
MPVERWEQELQMQNAKTRQNLVLLFNNIIIILGAFLASCLVPYVCHMYAEHSWLIHRNKLYTVGVVASVIGALAVLRVVVEIIQRSQSDSWDGDRDEPQ